jgi:hypothetical protein
MTTGQRLLIVQPWFSAIGHPAQSLFNTMRMLAPVERVDYLVSEDKQFEFHANLAAALGRGQRLFRFPVSSSALKESTVKCLWHMASRVHVFSAARLVLFFDVDLLALAKRWRYLSPLMRVEQLSLLYLSGPEQFPEGSSARGHVARLLQRKDVVLCVRTLELEKDWIEAFPDVDRRRIRTLPSLEIPEAQGFPVRRCERRTDLRFGVLGQLRRGKSLDVLAPLFSGRPDIGVLKVAGSFGSAAERDALRVLESLPGFEERYFEDAELLQRTAALDYVVVLYDNWDKRMESAVLYLAMRANRPIVAYSEGWCERMIEQFGCGVSVAREGADLAAFLESLPLPGDPGYTALLEGVARFREAHRADVLLPRFTACVGLERYGHAALTAETRHS